MLVQSVPNATLDKKRRAHAPSAHLSPGNPLSIAKHVQQSALGITYIWPWVKIQFVPPVNIRFNPTTEIGSKMGGEFTYAKMVHLPTAISMIYNSWFQACRIGSQQNGTLVNGTPYKSTPALLPGLVGNQTTLGGAKTLANGTQDSFFAKGIYHYWIIIFSGVEALCQMDSPNGSTGFTNFFLLDSPNGRTLPGLPPRTVLAAVRGQGLCVTETRDPRSQVLGWLRLDSGCTDGVRRAFAPDMATRVSCWFFPFCLLFFFFGGGGLQRFFLLIILWMVRNPFRST